MSASNIQEAVQVFADKEGIQIITTRVLNPEVMGPFTKIPIQLELSGQIDQLANFIKAIESTKSLLIVSELDARSLFPAAVIARQISVGQTPYRLCVPASLSQASLVFRQLHPRNSSQLH